jgi:hypothetical protein
MTNNFLAQDRKREMGNEIANMENGFNHEESNND